MKWHPSNGEESAELSVIYAVIPQVGGLRFSGSAPGPEGVYRLRWNAPADAPSGVTVSYTLREIPRPGAGSCPGDEASWDSHVSVGISGRRSEELEKGFGSAFCYRVQACYGDICGDWSSSFFVEVPVPGSPSLSLEDKDGDYDNSYTLRWTETAGADRYELKEWAQGGSEPSSGSGLGGDREKAYADMAYNKEYRYKARACTDGGCTDWSARLRVRVYMDKPQNLRSDRELSPDGAYGISWDGALGAVRRYDIEEKRDSLSWDRIIRSDPASNSQDFTDSSPSGHVHSPGASYSYRARSCGDVSGDSSCSGWLESGVLVRARPGKPGGLVLNNGNPVSISGNYTLSWDSVSGAEYYKIREKPDSRTSTPSFEVIEADRRSTSLALRDKPGHGDYEYQAQACAGADVCGEWSDIKSLTVTLGVPQGLGSDENPSYDGEYESSWVAFSYGYSVVYELQEKIGHSSTWPPEDQFLHGKEEASALIIRSASDSTDYLYHARACTDVGCGPYTTEDVPPVVLTVTLDTLEAPTLSVRNDSDALHPYNSEPENPCYDGEFYLEWTAVEGALTYSLERGSAEGADWTVLTRFSADEDFHSRIRTGSGSYQYRVRACSVYGCPDDSPSGISASVSMKVYDFSDFSAFSRVVGLTPGSTEVLTGADYTLRWNQIPGSESGEFLYKLYENHGNAQRTEVYSGRDFSYTLSKTEEGTYAYQISVCGERNRCFSAVTWPGLEVEVSSDVATEPEGSGAESDPYVITNYNQLGYMRENLSAHYVLGNNIDASQSCGGDCGNPSGEGWAPVGSLGGSGWFTDTPWDGVYDRCDGSDENEEHCFQGTLDGRGYVISDLYVNPTGGSRPLYGGLFGYIGQNAMIRNLGLREAKIRASSTGSYTSNVGVLVGYNYGGGIRNSYAISSSVSVSSSRPSSSAGGLIGHNAGTISNSYALVSVSSASGAGGLVGTNIDNRRNGGGAVSNSYAAGDVTGVPSETGALVGVNDYYGTISNSYGLGNVTGFASSDRAGALVGYNTDLVGHITISGKNYYSDRDRIDDCSGACEQMSVPGIRALTATVSGWSEQNWSFGGSTQLPQLKYVNEPAGSCGGSTGVTCGAVIPGQASISVIGDWYAGGWNGCSKPCGVGSQSRTVACEYDICGDTEPPSTRRCNTHSCCEGWSSCSTPNCGGNYGSQYCTNPLDRGVTRRCGSSSPRCCTSASWGDWISTGESADDTACGDTYATHTRTCNRSPSGCRPGSNCSGDAERTSTGTKCSSGTCSGGSCVSPPDCSSPPSHDWGACSVEECGFGEERCPGDDCHDSHTRDCNRTCPSSHTCRDFGGSITGGWCELVDCSSPEHDWVHSWSECSVVCGSGSESCPGSSGWCAHGSHTRDCNPTCPSGQMCCRDRCTRRCSSDVITSC